MKKLDENGRLVPAAAELSAGRDTRALVKKLAGAYPLLPLSQTNLAHQLPAFLYTVLANSGAVEESYLAVRPRLAQLAASHHLAAEGWLVLDEGAGHGLYAAQGAGTQAQQAFGRRPVLVYLEHTTGTVLYENWPGGAPAE